MSRLPDHPRDPRFYFTSPLGSEPSQSGRPRFPIGKFVLTFPDGSVLTTYANENGLDRDWREGPALHFKGPHGERGEYHSDGMLHRPTDDGPAIRETDADGNDLELIYAEHDVLTRDAKDGPAITIIANGIGMSEYRSKGELHRPPQGGAAHAEVDLASGITIQEEYWEHGDIVAGSRPWFIRRRADTGRIWCERWKERDPSEGPTAALYTPTGAIAWEEYWAGDRLLQPHEILAAKRDPGHS